MSGAATAAGSAAVNVGVDGRSLRASAGRRGVSRYLECLLTALAGNGDSYAVLLPGEPGPAAAEIAPLHGVTLHSTRFADRSLFAAGALTGRPRLDRVVGGCDVLWAPAVAPLAVSAEIPLVLTVHDLSFEHRTADFTRYERLWHRLARPRRLARRADRLIAVSDSVRRELIAEWGVDPGKVVTVPSGPGRPASRSEGRPSAAPVPPGYVLAVGALEPRKRPDLLVEAHARARASGLQAGLVFAGEGSLSGQLADAGATVLGRVPDEQLDGLYRDALALACVSREEGFGFTPLEALALGTPPVVSDLPVFAETLGAGALRVPPGDADALAGAMLQLERDPDLRERLVEAGRSAAGRLNWESAAAGTRTVLAEAAQGRR